MTPQPGDLVFGFERPHKPGTICGFPCEQCGLKPMQIADAMGKRLPDTPMFIVAEATFDDWAKSVKANGGRGASRVGDKRSFYFVRAD